MHLEVGLRAGSTYRDQAQNQQILSAESANYYAGIVATMPLYSGVEIDREQKLAIDRKLKTAEVVAQLLNALSAKRRAERMINLYASLEKRSQIRVRDGIVAVDEQIGYLEKVATTQGEIDTANAQIEGARLALIHQCQSDDVERLNNFILSEIN
jgi:predicted ribosome quality control (RQC) complex YloA/Tae2 family protein